MAGRARGGVTHQGEVFRDGRLVYVRGFFCRYDGEKWLFRRMTRMVEGADFDSVRLVDVRDGSSVSCASPAMGQRLLGLR